MPEVSGPEIVKETLIHRPNIKVIFISGYAEDAFLKSDEINIEDFHFLPKPFTLNELGNKVQSVLHKTKKAVYFEHDWQQKKFSNAKISCIYTIELFYT